MAQLVNGADFGRQYGGLSASRRATSSRLASPRGMMLALYPHMFQDTVFKFDDFNGVALNTFDWTADGDTGTTVFALGAGSGGVLHGSTATDDNEAISLRGAPVWKGDKNCGMAVRWQIDSVADLLLEYGFVDPLSDYTLPAINDLDTPTITNGAVTVATHVMDTDQTLVTMAQVCDGDATYATSKINLLWTPTVDNWYTSIIQLIGDTMISWVYDTNTENLNTLVAGGDSKAAVNKVEGGTLVLPWFLVANKAASAAKAPKLDFMAVWQDR